jgi:hypothetical protein
MASHEDPEKLLVVLEGQASHIHQPNKHLGTRNEVIHCFFVNGYKVFVIIDFVEVNQSIGTDLYLIRTLDHRDESLDVDFLVLLPLVGY